jgi:rod shape-determining protein MreD
MSLRLPALRLVLVGVIAVALQYSVFDDITVATYRPQLVLALAACCGAGGGSHRGALAGFALGLMVDLRGIEVMGVSALAYMVAGLVAGYVLTVTPDPQWWLSGLFAVLATAIGEASIPGIKQVIGQDGWLTTRALWAALVSAVFCAVVAPLLVPLGRWSVGVRRKKWKAMVDG